MVASAQRRSPDHHRCFLTESPQARRRSFERGGGSWVGSVRQIFYYVNRVLWFCPPPPSAPHRSAGLSRNRDGDPTEAAAARSRTGVTRTAVTWLLPGERDLGAIVLEARLQPVAGVVVPQLALEIARDEVLSRRDGAPRQGN